MSKTQIVSGGIADGTIATADIADDAVTADKATGLGISQVDYWLYNSTTNLSAKTFTVLTNWARPTDGDDEYGRIGTGMTHSSGVFTFPETGIYEATCMLTFQEAAANSPICYNEMQITDDGGSNWDSASTSWAHVENTSPAQNSASMSSFTIDVSNTSNVKLRIRGYGDENVAVPGDANLAYAYIKFIRLGDT
tara:strand:- start:65 stop:646 length:582 start_codon:yes stop_codon:yes gene_type:complete